MTGILFWVFSVISIGAALLCVTRRSPVASALWLVLSMFSLAGVYVLLDAQFIAAIQIMVYAGAIMVLFLFVIMLLNLGHETSSDMLGWPGRIFGVLLAAVLILELWVIRNIAPAADLRLPEGAMGRAAVESGVVQMIGEPLFQRYLVAFEVTGILLLAATAGAIVLAKRKL